MVSLRMCSIKMQSSQLNCNFDTPFKAWAFHILLEGDNRCLCKCHSIRIQTEKNVTSSQNMGRFGPGFVRSGHFGLILGVGRFSHKDESFRP